MKTLMEFWVLAVWSLPVLAVQCRAALLLPFWALGTRTLCGFLSRKELVLASRTLHTLFPVLAILFSHNALLRFQLTSHFLRNVFPELKLALPFQLWRHLDLFIYSLYLNVELISAFLPGLWAPRWHCLIVSCSTPHLQCLAWSQAHDLNGYLEEPLKTGGRACLWWFHQLHLAL